MSRDRQRAQSMNRIFYSNGNRSGIFLWHFVLRVPQNAKAPIGCRETEPGPGILLLVLSAVEMPADSAELEHTHKKTQISTQINKD